MRKYLNIVTCLLLAVMTASCMRIPLHDAEANLYLDLEIDYEIENASDIPMPEVIFVGFYDVDTHEFLSRDFTGPNGGPVNITPGIYDILVYNFDTEYTIVSDKENLYTIKATTNRVPSEIARKFNNIKKAIAQYKAAAANGDPEQSRSDYSDDPLINQPDYLFVGSVNNQEIPNQLDEYDVFKVHVKASTIVETFRLEITNITGIENIYSIDAFITGQIEAMTIGDGKPAGVPATIHVPLITAARSTSISSTFNTFGKYPPPEYKSYVLLHIIDNGGKETVYEYEVTDQFNDKENNGRTITVPIPIVIEPPSVEGGGMKPTVNQWGEERIDIKI